MLGDLAAEYKEFTFKKTALQFVLFLLLQRFLKADQNCPWHMMVSVWAAASKPLQVPPACCLTYAASASSCSPTLSLIFSVHAALAQPDNMQHITYNT